MEPGIETILRSVKTICPRVDRNGIVSLFSPPLCQRTMPVGGAAANTLANDRNRPAGR